jgi:EmrB/QacA subfamily drug resistance transporter
MSDIASTGQAISAENGNAHHFTQRETLLTVAGVLLVMLLSSLDQTIVATSMPHIIADLHGFTEYAWVSTAYLLTTTVTVPIYGKLSDIFGRKPIFIFGVVVFLLGSGLSGASQTITQLIYFRAFQGIGAGALVPIAIAVVGDLFTPRERGKWQGVAGAIFGLSSILGPLVGGWITDHSTWRWVFYVNLPVGIVALLVLILIMPPLRSNKKSVLIDYVGAALLVAGTVPLLLGFSWAGTQYTWNSPQIISLFIGSGIGLIAFFVYEVWLEHHGGQPIIEPSLFKNDIFAVSMMITFLFGMGLFGSIYFIPLYAQGVLGISATNSGLILTPLMLTSVVGSIVSGQVISQVGKYKILAAIGMGVAIIASCLLTYLGVSSSQRDLTIAMLVMGLGMGLGMSLYTIIVQNALPQKLGQVTASLTFFRSIGGTIALAAMGSILNNTYLPSFHSALPATVKQQIPAQTLQFFDSPLNLLSGTGTIQAEFAKYGPQGMTIYNQILRAVKTGLVQGVHNIFLLSVIIFFIAFMTVFFLREIPLVGKAQAPSVQEIGEATVEVVPEPTGRS